MKKNFVTMVNPQQIVNKKLRGCKSTRTVTTFAQKYGVPCVWWKPTASTKVLLVDWPQFRSTWKEYQQQTTRPTWKSTGSSSHTYKGTSRTRSTSTTKRTNTRTSYSTSPTRRKNSYKTNYRTKVTARRTRRAA